MTIRPLRVLCLPGKAFKGGNPYFRLFCEGLEENGVQTVEIKSLAAFAGRFDVIHLHFPEHYITEQEILNALKWGGFYLTFLTIAKLFGRKIVWSIHNVRPFKERHLWLLQPYMAVIRAIVDAHVFMSASSQAEFLRAFPAAIRKPKCEISHGAYPVSTPTDETILTEREKLVGTEPSIVIGFLGNVKKYKNVGALKAIPLMLPDGRKIKVVLAGLVDVSLEAEVESIVDFLGVDRVSRRNGNLSDQDLDLIIRSVDFVFLPYSKGWNSGLAKLVLCNFGRVISSHLPVFTDMASEFGRPWIYQYSSLSQLPEVIHSAVMDQVTASDRDRLNHALQTSSFAAAGSRLSKLYINLCCK